jgi:hypothetical protein
MTIRPDETEEVCHFTVGAMISEPLSISTMNIGTVSKR